MSETETPEALTSTQPALVVTRPGGREVLQVQDRPVPEPGPGEVLVEVAAAGVNFIDVYQREGVYPMETPFVLGKEGAGTVRVLGDGVEGVSPGDRVAWAMTQGTTAGWATLPSASLVPVPDEVELETAAAAMLQGMTAHFLVTDCAPISEGSVALVHAAAGGVGQLLVQMVVARGGHVVATAGSEEKCAIARSRGAAETIDYTAEDDLEGAIAEAAARLGAPDGVDVAYDGVGAATFDASLAALRPRGVLVLFGGASGQVPPFDIQRLNAGGSLYLTRPTLAHYIARREELLRRGQEVLAAVASGELDVAVDGRYPMTEAAEAYAALEGRTSTGKLLLVP